MIQPEEALEKIQGKLRPLPRESVPLSLSVERVLAENISACCDLPPFDNSAMDGYAVKTEDLIPASSGRPVRLRVRETLAAGIHPRRRLVKGEAFKIMTGAHIPKGADAVVMKELVREDKDAVWISGAARAGENIRRQGEDVRAGDRLLKRGTLIRPYEVALLAAQGMKRVSVVGKPRVAVIVTGSEVVPASQKPPRAKIRNSNGPALAAAISRWGFFIKDYGIAPDRENHLRRIFKKAHEASDILLVSGGVSVGDRDLTKSVLEKLGMKRIFWKIAIKPGKPLLFGLWDRKPVFGLPGNPVSALVCVEEFVRPALERMMGRVPGHPPYHLRGIALNRYPSSRERRQYLFCEAIAENEHFNLRILRPQGSAMMAMAAKANALAVSPIGTQGVKPGDTLLFRWLK